MIAKWIAQALIRGEDHLTLTKAELAEWQANGCRVMFGAPNGKHRHYQLRQIYWWRTHLIERLIEMDPLQWPIGEIVLEFHGNKTSVSMPRCDFQNEGDEFWRVPLIPEDVDHRLDAWSFDISLSEAELEAVRPFAHQLVKRTSLLNQFQTGEATSNKVVLPWPANKAGEIAANLNEPTLPKDIAVEISKEWLKQNPVQPTREPARSGEELERYLIEMALKSITGEPQTAQAPESEPISTSSTEARQLMNDET